MVDEQDILDIAGLRRLKSSPWADIYRVYIENSCSIPAKAPADVREMEVWSQAMTIRVAFLDEAVRHCEVAGYEPNDRRALDLVQSVFDVGHRIALSAEPISEHRDPANWTSRWMQRNFRLTGRVDPGLIIHLARNEELPRVDLDGLESAVSSYLGSDIRLPGIDRLLLVALVETETLGFFRHVSEKDILNGRDAFSIAMGQSALPTFLLWRAVSLFLAVVVALPAFLLGDSGFLPVWLAITLIVIAFLFFTLDTLVAIVGAIAGAPKRRDARAKLSRRFEEMLAVLREVSSHGPLSVKRVRQRLSEAETKGVVWPSSIWSILADLEARGVINLTLES